MSRVPLRGLMGRRYPRVVLAGLLLLLSSNSALADSKQVRLALVIGNSAYANPDEALPGVTVDAKNVADALEKQLFIVRTETNLTRQEMMNAVQQFKRNLNIAGSNAIGFLYYAGHGGADRDNSDNFLIPVDAEVKDIDVSGVSVRWIQNELQELNSPTNHPAAVVVVVDACRTLTQVRGDRGITQASGNRARPAISAMTKISEPEQGFLFAFSTSKNQSASDSGYFAQELIHHMSRKGLTIPGVFEEVQRELYRKTRQFPIYQNSIAARICLVSCESDTNGAFTRNKLLLEEAQKEAESSLKRIETLGAPNRCQSGWGSAMELYESAQKHKVTGNLDTAGETYGAVTGRTLAIESYLSSMDMVTESTKKLEAIREEAISSGIAQEKSMFISPYRNIFKDLLGSLANTEKTTGHRIDWSQLRQIDAQMEAFSNSGNYLDATERAIEGYNLGLNTLERILGSHQGMPIPKEDRIQTFKMARELRQRKPATAIDLISILDNTPGARACK